MWRTAMYAAGGYLSGSILFARVFAGLFGKKGMIENSRDGNPGAANAFMNGGFWCGVLTLAGDLLKGFLPVFLFMHDGGGALAVQTSAVFPAAGVFFPQVFLGGLVIAAPVIGHGFPVFCGFRGGKGIAVTFGCLLGLLPLWQPVAVLALFFIFFSAALRITPHYHRTLAAYLCSLAAVCCTVEAGAVRMGFSIITLTVCARLFMSKEAREKMGVRLLWMH